MTWMIIGVLVLASLTLVILYNRLVSLRQGTKQAFANIDAQLRMRTDLIPNLVNTVKGYAAHEATTLENVMKARAASQNASTVGAAAQADGLMTAALGKLFAVAESYPDLKASQNFLDLQSELSDVENKIAAARRFLNSASADYNGAIEQFPAVMFSRMLGFKAADMFEIPAADRDAESKAPTVSF